MLPAESSAWLQTASVETIRDIITESKLVQSDWLKRIQHRSEYADLTGVTDRRPICPRHCAIAAARVSVELSIITAIWPDRPGDVLRPSWE